jgi:group II intron reverse transcriptase/maturase
MFGTFPDMDIEAFFDSIDHDLLMRAVEKHVPEKWIRLYIRRWLESPVERADGIRENRDRGTPQGGVISPLLANLFLHYAFDVWMQRHHAGAPFERYADDIVCHCRSREEAESLLESLRVRLVECGLRLHPEKTRLVYCMDGRRCGDHLHTGFDFLGFSFHARTVQSRSGNVFTGFNPAVSRKAMKRMNTTLRKLKIPLWCQAELPEIAAQLNPLVRGWVQYYNAFSPGVLKRFLVRIDLRLGRWARNKYKRLRGHKRRSWAWLRNVRETYPTLFVHWDFVYGKGDG